MSGWAPDVVIQIWDEETVEALALRIERCAASIAELGPRGAMSTARAYELTRSLRAAGKALAFVDEDDADAVFVVIERLDNLKRESEGLLALRQGDDVTRQYDDRLQRMARLVSEEDEPTRVQPRIIAPARLAAQRGR